MVRPIPARAALVAVALAVTSCSGGDPFEPLPVPVTNPQASTTTTAPPDFSGVALAPVEGTTTTSEVLIGPGPATLAGRVDGPDGAVALATVRLERLVGDAVATLDVTTDDDGGWQAANVLGGRYRVRAWRAPYLASLEPQILFVGGGTTEVMMVVERFRATVVDLAVAPDRPRVGGRTNVLVRVSSQVVGDDGVVRVAPRPGVEVVLAADGRWSSQGPVQALTDSAGGATFTLVCGAPGFQALTATIAPGEVFPLAPPECVVPPPPDPAPSVTVPPGSSTSTTAR